MDNQEKINEICKRERRVSVIKEWLVIAFFLTCFAVVLLIVYFMFTNNNQETPKNIINVLISFAVILFFGFAYNNSLSKKLNRLWEEKKELF